MLLLAKLPYQKVSYCSTWGINTSTCQINHRTGQSILEKKKCHSSCFFCNRSYTVISNQFSNSRAQKEKPNKETLLWSGEKKRNEIAPHSGQGRSPQWQSEQWPCSPSTGEHQRTPLSFLALTAMILSKERQVSSQSRGRMSLGASSFPVLQCNPWPKPPRTHPSS